MKEDRHVDREKQKEEEGGQREKGYRRRELEKGFRCV